MMLYDFDMEKHIESEKAYEYERGREDMEKDMEKTLVSRWWKKGKNIEEIVEDLGKPEQCDKLEISSMILFDLSKTRIIGRTLIIFYDLTDIFNKCERNREKGNRSPCTKCRDFV